MSAFLLAMVPVVAADDAPDVDADNECPPLSHPLVQSIANRFDVSAEDVLDLHCAGYGFGTLIRVYLLLETAEEFEGEDIEDILTLIDEEGWGAVLALTETHPALLAPGLALRDRVPPGLARHRANA
ncbi:MAG: hypothetical protein EA396_12590, partial [Anaerolineaceae bacterium]